jgi:hypothetical protein
MRIGSIHSGFTERSNRVKKAKIFMALAAAAVLACAILPSPAQAYPYVSRACTDCHLLDANVVVAATPLGCTVRNGQTLASYDYRLTVSNTFEQLEAYAVFDGPPTSTTNIKYGYGPYTGGVDVVLSLNQSRTFTLRGASDSDIGYGKGGSNFVTVTTPFCAACIDADGDGFASAGGSCGGWDCNDADPLIKPGATDIANNGVDENCNGFDLTIVVTKAAYSSGKKTLTIEATSQLGANAGLSASYYISPSTLNAPPMTWNEAIGKWQVVVANLTAAPSTATVSGIEGASTAKVTKGK